MTIKYEWISAHNVPVSVEQAAKRLLCIGDTVICLGERSRHRGQIGVITSIDFYVTVVYPNTHLEGLHPAVILKKVELSPFEEELFEI